MVSTLAERRTRGGGRANDRVVNYNIAKDIVLWRRRTQSATILIASTATWVLMQVYQFKFITLFSWLAIFLLASSFLCANMLRLLGKEPPSLSGFEMTEESAMQMAHTIKACSEEGIRLMFRLTTEEGWPLFLGLVAGLWSLSYIASKMDFLTFLYMGIIVSTTVPVIYVKNENRIKSLVEWLKAKSKRSYEIFDERAIQKIKTRVINESEMKKQNDEKKAE
ncbi:reticulon-like protein B13 [Senna tora]|uniref:Reticulon-like protein n=1 Tax=Senna tora TaxID=362788 RepID=A0A834TWY8_9FABA|nr:reticulon-like protein B13 [Senna tora]